MTGLFAAERVQNRGVVIVVTKDMLDDTYFTLFCSPIGCVLFLLYRIALSLWQGSVGMILSVAVGFRYVS
jgi:hypothetical protein